MPSSLTYHSIYSDGSAWGVVFLLLSNLMHKDDMGVCKVQLTLWNLLYKCGWLFNIQSHILKPELGTHIMSCNFADLRLAWPKYINNSTWLRLTGSFPDIEKLHFVYETRSTDLCNVCKPGALHGGLRPKIRTFSSMMFCFLVLMKKTGLNIYRSGNEVWKEQH